jgi:gas vesicle protein
MQENNQKTLYKDIANKCKTEADIAKLNKDSDNSIYQSCPYIDEAIKKLSSLNLDIQVYEEILLNLEKTRKINEMLRENSNENYETLQEKYHELENQYEKLEKEKNDFIANYGSRHYYSLDELGYDLTKEIKTLTEEVEHLQYKYE